jgi:hypothetical protein
MKLGVSLEKVNAQAYPTTLSGKADTTERMQSKTASRCAGVVATHAHKESARNTENPMAWSGMSNRKIVSDVPSALGRRRVL